MAALAHVHSRELLNAGDVVIVNSDTQCNVMITDDHNYRCYEKGESFKYFGGAYEYFPVRIVVPSSGWWNITIDAGRGYKLDLKYSINLEKA